jgi:hypothetical protein
MELRKRSATCIEATLLWLVVGYCSCPFTMIGSGGCRCSRERCPRVVPEGKGETKGKPSQCIRLKLVQPQTRYHCQLRNMQRKRVKICLQYPKPQRATKAIGSNIFRENFNLPRKVQLFWPPLCSSGQSSWLQIQRSGIDSRRYQIFWEVVGLERGPLSLVSILEEVTEWYV